MASAASGMTLSLGSDGPPGCYADIELADAFLFIGSNAADCHPIVFDRVADRVRGIPEALREFRESFPTYSLRITPADGPIVTQELLNGSLDLGIVVRHQKTSKLIYHELFEDTLGFIVSPLHRWARAGKVDRRELSQQRMILYNRQSTTFRLVQQYFVRARAELRDWIELGSIEAIKELVKLGLGVSVAGEWTARTEVSEGSLVWLPLPAGRLKRSWCIAHPSGRTLTLAEQTFIDLCQSAGSVIVREYR
jgi:DNA-binding transcriptional LysR family regulator